MAKYKNTSIHPYSTTKIRFLAGSRKARGFGLVEAFTSAIFIVVAVVVSLDCWFMIMAARINDSACRDAARAASQAGSSSSDASNAAIAAATSYGNMGAAFMVSPPQVTVLAYNNTTSAVTNGNTTTPPLSVTVTSTCTVRTLVPMSFLSNNNITYTETKTYPIVPSTTGVQANNIPSP